MALKLAKVRMYLKSGETLEGFLAGKPFLGLAGHYKLDISHLVEGENRTRSLDGRVAVPRQNVKLYQELP